MRALAVAAALVVWLCAAPAQAQQVRLAASAGCPSTPGCGAGLASVYGLDVRPHLVPIPVAGAGIEALDNGLAEVAVAFSSNPEVSRPDVVTLRDDRHMQFPDHVAPVVRKDLLRAYRPAARRALRRQLNAASAVLTTLALRELNGEMIDGRLPEAVGGGFVDANGLGGTAPRRRGPRIVMGFQDFPENQMLAQLYAEALRAGGFRVVVRSVHGLRAEAVRLVRHDRIDMWPGYSGSLLRYLVGATPKALAAGLRHTLGRIGVEPMRLAPAQDRDVFVTKTDIAARLGLARISDLARYWQTPAP